MNASEGQELHQLNNQVADIGDSFGVLVTQLIEIKRLMWARLIVDCGSWESAGNCYLQGIVGAERVRKDLASKGGDAHV